jgi:hypothetical protein
VNTRDRPAASLHRPWKKAIAIAVALAAGSSGCLSHEYKVSQEELARLAQLPPETRGASIRVVQELGSRRGDAVQAQPYQPAPEPEGGGNVDVEIDLRMRGGGGHHHATGGPVSGPPVSHVGGARPTFQGSAPAARGGTTFQASGAHAGGTPTGVRPSGGGGGGSGLGNLGSGGGGNDGLVVLAVVVVAVAVLAVFGLAVTEGVRYDGEVWAAPGQVLYLDTPAGERPVALGDLTLADAAAAKGALLRDDEGWGLGQRGRAPLDRRGVAFKVDLGGFSGLLDHYSVDGLASHIQLGVFPWQNFGLMATWAVDTGSDAQGNLFARHGFALEAQAFPVRLGPLSLGACAHGGPSLSSDGGGGIGSHLALGGGPLIELALTTRLALTFRADWTATRLQDGWTPSRSFSGGLAIY